jgi:hypothetical protein
VKYGFNGASIDYYQDEDHTDMSISPSVQQLRVGTHGAVVQQPAQRRVCQPHPSATGEAQWRPRHCRERSRNYSQRNKSVSSEGYSAQTELSMTVNVKLHQQQVNHKEDFERSFTATQTYETTQSLASVQEELVTQMCKDLTDQIFNATVANW